jgi:hypothetical protein
LDLSKLLMRPPGERPTYDIFQSGQLQNYRAKTTPTPEGSQEVLAIFGHQIISGQIRNERALLMKHYLANIRMLRKSSNNPGPVSKVS